uniref:Hepatitis TT virus Orf2/Gyrovirus Vp2 N-terminal domain-containing protein n=1 Tax=TTV-like mini virus TaxID=93678 RepID=A0A286Q760_9VIRU|nr:hypothetical protein [TTV-like mini virus]
MSRYLQNPTYSPRALETKWLNNIVETHALICSCETPFDHLKHLLEIPENNGSLPKKNVEKLQKTMEKKMDLQKET